MKAGPPRFGGSPRMPNQTPLELDREILAMTEQYPTYSYPRYGNQFKLMGVGVSVAALRYV